MSKSLGNFFTVRDLLDQGVPGEVIRFVFLQTHYAKPMDWTAEKARIAKRHLRRWWEIIGPPETQLVADEVPAAVLRALENDLDTHSAIKALFDLEKQGKFRDLAAGARLLGLLERRADYDMMMKEPDLSEEVRNRIERLGLHWFKYRNEKKYKEADEIRNIMASAGMRLFVDDNGTPTFTYDNPDLLDEINLRDWVTQLDVILATADVP